MAFKLKIDQNINMKHSGLLMILAAFLFLSSCADKPTRPSEILTEAQKSAADAAASVAASQTIQSAATSGTDLPHYYCANSCEGSGSGSPGSCPTCGTAYTHNDAFHNKAPTPQPMAPTTGQTTGQPLGQTLTSPVTMGGDNSISTTVTPPKAPEPPQNAKGVWHYTCSAGCAGGAGGAGTCASCGGALAHNSEYHN